MNAIMKNSRQLIFNISVWFDCIDAHSDVVATDIVPITNDRGEIINSAAYQNYLDFLGMLEQILDLYDFHFTVASTNSVTSSYYWVARNTEIAEDNVPYYIRLRVSDHVQSFGPEGKKVASNKDRQNAEKLKLPENKKRQKYILRSIIVNEDEFRTYEEALTAVEAMIREWIGAKGIDVEDKYGPANIW